MIGFLTIALGSYLIGSIPSGYIAGRIRGIDIRKVGSGNIGATNVLRSLGKPYGYAVFAADFSKGFLAVMLSKFIAQHTTISGSAYQLPQITAAVFCVIGNAFPIWLRFRGGKGVATSAGLLFALMPLAALLAIVVWLVTFQITRYVSLASIIATALLPVIVALFLHFGIMTETSFLYVSIALAAVIILRHRSNLLRLLNGTEQRFRRSGN